MGRLRAPGAALVGAAVATTLVEYGLLAPTAVVTRAFALAVAQSWRLRQRPVVPMAGDPFQAYLVGWPVVLAIAAGVGVVERDARNAASGERRDP